MTKLTPRKFERKRFVGEVVVRPLLHDTPQPAHVFDLAQSGLAVFVGQSLVAGQSIEVTFPVGQPAVQAGLEKRVGRVVRSRTHPDGNVAGIAFNEPLESGELKVLEANWVRS
jgi:hypothetical protein